MQIGEAFVGEGAQAAHVNTVLGHRTGPAGTAWASALASPSAGHVPFVAVVRPGVPVQPMTLFVNKATIASDEHGRLTWGAAQAGVAAGIADAVADGFVTATELHDLCVIAAVWVDPAASDADAVYRNNRQAARDAIVAGVRQSPDLRTVLEARAEPWNPYFRPGA
ncbi:MAG: formaldehyde-activating enzyme [Actinomycetes bacterium]